MCQSSSGMSPGSNRFSGLNSAENQRSQRQIMLHLQSLLRLLESLPSEVDSSNNCYEPEDFEVYDDEDYRYVNLVLPEDTEQEIDMNLSEKHLFIRMAL